MFDMWKRSRLSWLKWMCLDCGTNRHTVYLPYLSRLFKEKKTNWKKYKLLVILKIKSKSSMNLRISSSCNSQIILFIFHAIISGILHPNVFVSTWQSNVSLFNNQNMCARLPVCLPLRMQHNGMQFEWNPNTLE